MNSFFISFILTNKKKNISRNIICDTKNFEKSFFVILLRQFFMKEIVQNYVKIYLFDLFFLIKKFIIYFFVNTS